LANILVVEDEPDILRLVLMQLQLAGHRATGARSAQEALELVAREGPPDVAVLDVAMPEMNGLELLRRLRDQDGAADLPVIFLSARVQPENIAAGEALGAIYLTKPFEATALLGAIDRSVGRRDGAEPPP
jgi:CheY-like chemotaxis protein